MDITIPNKAPGSESDGILDVPIFDDMPRFASLEYLGRWFPEADPAHPKAQTWRIWRSKRRRVLTACSIVAFLVFLANLVTTIYFRTTWQTVNDLGTIFRGDCSQSHQLSSRLHLVINVLSTILFAASNFCMQHLAAPIRKEIDEAHGNYIWLDIGVPSFRNLWHISMKRRIVILLLAVTSIPLHFLQVAIKMGIGIRTDPHGHRYNSTIIPTLAVNSFAYALVDQSFLEGGPWNASETAQAQLSQAVSSRNLTWMLQSWHDLDLQSTIRSMQVNANSNTQYTRMDPLECILAYNRLLGNHSDFIMVSTTASESDNSLLAYGMSVSGTWDVGYSLCSGGEQFDCGRLENLPSHEQVEAVRDWNIGGYKIDSCLSSQRSTKNLCSVEYSFQMMSSTSRCAEKDAEPEQKIGLIDLGF